MHVYMSMLVVTTLSLFCFSDNADSQYILHFLVHASIVNFAFLFELHVLYYSI